MVSQMVSAFVAGAALLGGWAAYHDFSAQWRVANAERQMDQYAQTAMVEIVNLLEFSMGALPINSGVNSRWKIGIGEQINEHGGLDNRNTANGGFAHGTDGYFTQTQYAFGHVTYGGFVILSHHPDRGILINNTQPKWANTAAAQWVWRGRQVTNGRTELAAFDHRDRMRMTELSIDFPFLVDPYANLEDDPETFIMSAIKVKIVMQYRYRSTASFSLFGNDYVRERIYETTVSPANYGKAISDNPFYKEFVQGRPYG